MKEKNIFCTIFYHIEMPIFNIKNLSIDLWKGILKKKKQS